MSLKKKKIVHLGCDILQEADRSPICFGLDHPAIHFNKVFPVRWLAVFHHYLGEFSDFSTWDSISSNILSRDFLLISNPNLDYLPEEIQKLSLAVLAESMIGNPIYYFLQWILLPKNGLDEIPENSAQKTLCKWQRDQMMIPELAEHFAFSSRSEAI